MRALLPSGFRLPRPLVPRRPQVAEQPRDQEQPQASKEIDPRDITPTR